MDSFPDDAAVDLHTHSLASDGSDSPSSLVKNAVAAGLAALALTDHDTVSGLDEFLEAAHKENLFAVPGLEFSCFLNSKEVHILGLFIDRRNETLLRLLEMRRQDRIRRNLEIIEKLRASGFNITREQVAEYAGGESVGRPHIARALVASGYFANMKEVFAKCLKRGCPCFVPRTPLTPAEAIRTVKEAGGLAIWAHPLLCVGERGKLRGILKVLRPAGLDGMETYYTLYSKIQQELAQNVAKEFGLLESGGSDYHGLNQPGIALGKGGGNLHVPASVLNELLKRIPADRRNGGRSLSGAFSA